MFTNRKIKWTQLLRWILLIAVLSVACRAGTEEDATPTVAPAVSTEESDTEAQTAVTPQPPAQEEERSAVEETENVETVTIRLAVYDFELGRYEDLADSFEELNPDIDVRLVSINEILDLEGIGGQWPEDASVRLASAADVLINADVNSMAREGLLLDLSPFIEADTNFNSEDFFPGLLEQYQWDGGTWALPSSANFNLIYFYKDAFDEAGVDYPEPGWTWDDFLATAQTLTIREGDEVSQWGFVELSFNPLGMIQSYAGPLLENNVDPASVNLERAEVIEAVRWYTDLFLTHEVAPYYPPPDPDDEGPFIPKGYELIENEQAAMWAENSSTWQWRSQQSNLGVVPFPVSDNNANSTPLYSSGYAISAGTQKPDTAWRWINFLTRQTGEDFFGSPNALPARQSVAEAANFWDDVDEEFAAALRYATDHSYTSTSGEFSQPLREEIQAIIEDGKPVADAMADAQAATEEAIAEGELEEGDATPTADIVVAESEPEEEVSEDAVVIEFLPGIGSVDLGPIRDLAEQFHETHPDIVVEVKSINFTSGAFALQDMAADADCFQWFPSLDDDEARAAILNLEPFLDADPEISPDDFFPAVLDQFTYQGQIMGLPSDISVTLINYNKDLFDEAGVDYPTLDWTTDDFLEIAVALTAGEDEATKQYGYVPDLFEVNDMFLMIDRLGAQLIDDSTDPPSFTFTDPTVVEAMRWYVNLTNEYGVKPVYQTDLINAAGSVADFQGRQELIDNGRAALWVDSGTNIPLGQQEEQDTSHIGVVPLPAGPDGRRSGGFSSAGGYFISADTNARQQCWQWITFLTERPSENAILRGMPARRSTADSEAYRQQVGEEYATAALASVTGASGPGYFQRFTEGNAWLSFSIFWLSNAYDQALNEDVPLEEALQSAQEIADEYRSCIIAREGFSDDEIQQACVQEADESIPDFFFPQSDDE